VVDDTDSADETLRDEQAPDSAEVYPPTTGLPEPEAVPPTMPEQARTGWAPPPPPPRASAGPAADERGPAGAPPGTVPEVPPAPGTSEELPPVAPHTPDVGPDGADLDTSERPVPGRIATERS